MKKLLFGLLFVSSSLGSVIGDFAPIKIGSSWKYSYTSTDGYVGTIYNYDSGTVEVTILSMQPRGIDTLILMHIKEQGRSKTLIEDSPFDYNKDFVDTAIISGDSIFQPQTYHCKLFPFWKSHYIDSSLLAKGISESSPKYYLSNSLGYTYLQNVGLYSRKFQVFMNHFEIKTINLLSYNGAAIDLGVKTAMNNARKLPLPSHYVKRISITHARFGQTAFSISGKKISPYKNMPNSVLIFKNSSQNNTINK